MLQSIDIDFREEVKELESAYGINVVHIQNSKYIKCKCFNDLYKTGNPKCNLCFGTGRVTTLSIKKAIKYNQEGGSVDTELGNIVKDKNVFIFNHTYEISEKDYILMVGFNNGCIKDIKNQFEVEYVDEVRGDRGRIEYKIVYTKNCNYKSQMENSIKKLRNNKIQYLSDNQKILIGDLNGI